MTFGARGTEQVVEMRLLKMGRVLPTTTSVPGRVGGLRGTEQVVEKTFSILQDFLSTTTSIPGSLIAD
jgi:hypothetical protein